MKKMTKKMMKEYLSKGPQFMDAFNSLECQHRVPNHVHKDVKKAVAIARKFNEEVLEPIYLKEDIKCMEDHDYLPLDFMKKAAEWRLYSLFVPKLFGGKGLNLAALYPFIEEIASVCSGLGHIIFVHYLGIATVFPSYNLRIISKILRDVVRSEKKGMPHLLDLVITEPEAGTDTQEPILLDRAKIGTTIEKVKGGYNVNGRKIFISNGHLSYWHIVMAPFDRNRVAESFMQFVVTNESEGFSFGAREHKMGHLASTASELIFEDCFVPEKDVTISAGGNRESKLNKSARWITHSIIDYVVSSSRAGVSAISTGMARNAYETALEYASKKHIAGDLLINHQWAQIMLTDMYRNVNISRITYMENVYADMLSGMYKMLFKKPLYYFMRFMPKWYFWLITPLFKLNVTTWFFRKYYFDWYKDEERDASSGWGSLSKYTCSDIGVTNAGMAMDLMGADGLRHESGAEKLYRDAKLQQIYESTNQINQMNLFACLVGRDIPGLEIFK